MTYCFVSFSGMHFNFLLNKADNPEKLNIKGACGEAFKEVLISCSAKKKSYENCMEMKRHFIECLHWNPEWPESN